MKIIINYENNSIVVKNSYIYHLFVIAGAEKAQCQGCCARVCSHLQDRPAPGRWHQSPGQCLSFSLKIQTVALSSKIFHLNAHATKVVD